MVRGVGKTVRVGEPVGKFETFRPVEAGKCGDWICSIATTNLGLDVGIIAN
jgi:hypothetical protein